MRQGVNCAVWSTEVRGYKTYCNGCPVWLRQTGRYQILLLAVGWRWRLERRGKPRLVTSGSPSSLRMNKLPHSQMGACLRWNYD
jgi:hypothetical protein